MQRGDPAFDQVRLGALFAVLAIAMALALCRPMHGEPVSCQLSAEVSAFSGDEIRAVVAESDCGGADLEVRWRVIVPADAGRTVSTARVRLPSPAFLTVERDSEQLATAEVRDLRAGGRVIRRGLGLRFTFDGTVHRVTGAASAFVSPPPSPTGAHPLAPALAAAPGVPPYPAHLPHPAPRGRGLASPVSLQPPALAR